MNRKHIICYTLTTFCACQKHQNIDIWVSKINTFEIQPSTQHTAHSTQLGGKLVNNLRARGHFTSTLGSPCLPEATKIIDFTTHTTTCCNEQKTYYLLYFSYILCMPKTPKYRHLGIQNQHFRNTTKPGTQLPHPDTRNPDPCCQES